MKPSPSAASADCEQALAAETAPVPSILIVEDENVLRLTFEQFLRDEGYEVAAAANYAEAVAALDEQAFDVVISDIILGGRTGIDLLRGIQESGHACQVIMITGDPSVNTASEAVRLGAFDYLPKPVKERDLLRVTRLALDRAKLSRERDRYAAEVDQARRELEVLFNSVTEGIVTVDAALCVSHVNDAARRMLSLPDGALKGRHLLHVLPKSLETATQALQRALDSGQPALPTRIDITDPRGARAVLEFNTAPLIGAGGAVLVVRDLTRLSRLEESLEETQGFHGIVGKSPAMRQLFELIEDVKSTDSTVLLCGESGTGKEEIASVIQRLSSRAKGSYIKINCAALAEDVLESELFGHVKGAFTGAIKDRVGRFEAANGGTILLDEIGDVSPKVQLRLLRVLQEREFERVGDTRPIHTDVRVIATTNQSLTKKIATGQFRQDLYYRLNVVRIEVPPLRVRREDIPLLIEHFRRHFNAVMNKDVAGLSPETLDLLMKHGWEGNVRELENCMERAFVVCRDPEILPRHLPPEIRGAGDILAKAPSGAGAALQSDGAPTKKDLSREEIEAVLGQTDWNVAKSAKKLGIARNTLYLHMKNLGLLRPDA
jgi:PAS domain S-box-containing protein